MIKKPSTFLLPVLVLALLVAVPGVSTAQNGPASGIEITFLKPSIDNTAFMNSAIYLGYYNMFNESMGLQVWLPMAIYDPDISGVDGEFGIGNPYLGIKKYCQKAPLSFSGGVWLPVASEDKLWANLMGSFADPTMVGAFHANTLTLDLAANYKGMVGKSLVPFAGVGPSIAIPTKDEFEVRDTEVYINFGGGLFYNVNKSVMVGGGVNGYYWVTEDDVDPIYQFTFGGMVKVGGLNPGLFVTLPLGDDNYKDFVDSIIGIYLGVPLGK